MTKVSRTKRPDVAAVLDRLKGFQRAAVEVAFHRLYASSDGSKRFLIADEVGLGKTLIARGIAAKAIDHMWEDVERIDVVYICSNLSIARQNLERLQLGEPTPVDRLTMLPLTAGSLTGSGGKPNKLNFFAFTPATSFDHGSHLGAARERLLIYHMMQDIWWVGGSGPKNLLQGTVQRKQNWRERIRNFPKDDISKDLQKAFARTLESADETERMKGGCGIRARWEEACSDFRYYKKRWPDSLKVRRGKLVAELRRLLAKSCIGALEPDLVILDEFQRFKHLLDTENVGPAAELAQELFGWQGEKEGEAARVLLLSATPYKMYTLAHEAEEDDHYEDFLRTVEFLQSDAVQTDELRADLALFRRETLRFGQSGESILPELRGRIERSLRRVMSRTERTLPGQGGDGMLQAVAMPNVSLQKNDLVDYLGLQQVARAVERPNLIELWKSSPYLLSMADSYAFVRDIEKAVARSEESQDLLSALDGALSSRLSPEDIAAYKRIDPQNARLRSLETDVLDSGLWRCLWMPPSMPSYELGEPFASVAKNGATKRLIFSAWNVVPKAISGLLSYEVERRVHHQAEDTPGNSADERKLRKGLLQIARSGGRVTGMPVLAMMYPSPALAWLGDPRSCMASAEKPTTLEEVLRHVECAIQEELKPVVSNAPDDGPEDESWYWAAPILLDLCNRNTGPSCRKFWKSEQLASDWAKGGAADDDEQEDAGVGWLDHVQEALGVVNGERDMGRVPNDLVSVLARLAIGGPANASLRALHRVCQGSKPHSLKLRIAAAQIGWGFRSYFNGPEAMSIVRKRGRKTPYWQKVLTYCCAGALGDLLDEHFHVCRDQLGLFDAEPGRASQGIAMAMVQSLTLRAARQEYHSFHFEREGDRPTSVTLERQRLRGHFAMRFGNQKSESDDKAGQRTDDVRAAFNSPFWPFVLASTSVGQEGLDFHPWCHAVVHWNLPSNPVDLEQREGRVHRFMGHAVRKNVAADFAATVRDIEDSEDPWRELFVNARQATINDRNGLVPFWIYPREGGASIERRVPCLPLSRDALRLDDLRRSLAVYRMVFGQPRQDELLAFLLERIPAGDIEEAASEMRINLAP